MHALKHIALSAALVPLALWMTATAAQAAGPLPEPPPTEPLPWDESVPESDDDFFCVQHAIAAEGRYQSPKALLEMARAIRDKGACFRSRNWLSSWGVAVDVLNDPARDCAAQYHCQAFFRFETIPPDVREPVAVAAHLALTETPHVRRYHFTGRGEPLYDFWFSPRACPNGYFEEDKTRYC